MVLAALAASGCGTLRLPAIDPNGERLFLPTPSFTTLAPWDKHSPATGLPGGTPPGFTVPPPGGPFAPADPFATGVVPPPPLGPPPVGVGPVVGPPPSYGPPAGATGMAAAPCAGGGGPGPDVAAANVEEGNLVGKLVIYPPRVVAPVGTEVCLRAGLCGPDGYYITREPVHWSLTRDSVGTIVAVDQTHDGPLRRLIRKHMDQTRTGDYAVTYTSPVSHILTRGTPMPQDDIWMLEGQTWITVTSPTEGTSHVAISAPQVMSWCLRQQTATVFWVDGQWCLPRSAVARLGEAATLVTRVRRQTSGQPIGGWIVRYEVIGGQPVTMNGQPGPVLEVTTDGAGAAPLQLVAQAGVSGPTSVTIQVIRPPTSPSDAGRLVVGEGLATVTWTEANVPTHDATPAPRYEAEPGLTPEATTPPQLEADPDAASVDTPAPRLELVVDGEERANVGDPVQFRITVKNDSVRLLTGVTITDRFDEGLARVNSSTGQVDRQSPVELPLGTLNPGETRRVAINLVAERPGIFCHEVQVAAREAANTIEQRCFTATVAPAPAEAPPTSPPAPGPAFPPSPIGPVEPRLPEQPVGPPPGGLAGQRGLELSVECLNNPVRVGGKSTFLVTITNARAVSDANIALQVLLPAGTKQWTIDPPPAIQYQVASDNRTLNFTPIAELRPTDKPVVFRVTVTAVAAETLELRARVGSTQTPTPIERSAEATVLSP